MFSTVLTEYYRKISVVECRSFQPVKTDDAPIFSCGSCWSCDNIDYNSLSCLKLNGWNIGGHRFQPVSCRKVIVTRREVVRRLSDWRWKLPTTLLRNPKPKVGAQVPQAIWEIRPCDLWSSRNSEIIRICMGKNDSFFNLKIRMDCQ